jgi:hypothetical protein
MSSLAAKLFHNPNGLFTAAAESMIHCCTAGVLRPPNLSLRSDPLDLLNKSAVVQESLILHIIVFRLTPRFSPLRQDGTPFLVCLQIDTRSGYQIILSDRKALL